MGCAIRPGVDFATATVLILAVLIRPPKLLPLAESD